MTKLIIDTLEYFFGFSPSTSFSLQWIAWAAIASGLIVAFYLIFKIKKTQEKILKKILQEYPGKLITIAFLLFINIFSRLNSIEVLSMRFITYVLIGWLFYSYYELSHDLMVTFPKKTQEQKNKVDSLEKKYHIHKNKKKKTRVR